MENPYITLGCDETDTEDIITKKYKKLAFKYHPDRNVSATIKQQEEYEQKFKKINCAYHYLKKNNFKYNNTGDYKHFLKSFFKNKSPIIDFATLYDKIKQLKSLDFNKISDNVLKEIININEFYNLQSDNYPKTDDIDINANIDIFDIYNNVKKEITLLINRKCNKCNGKGIDLNFNRVCIECGGEKIVQNNEIFTFNSMFKNIVFFKKSHYEHQKSLGNININLIPKKNAHFSIVNYYDILYKHYIDLSEKPESIKIVLSYLDLKDYTLSIINPIYNNEYIIDNMGLFIPNKNRASLIIILSG